MSQTRALSSTKDVPFSKSKNSVQVSEPNIFYSCTTSAWKHLIFLWTASIHNPSLVVLTWLKLCSFLIYQYHSFWLQSAYSQAGSRRQIGNCKRTENFIFPHPTDISRQGSPHRTCPCPRAGHSQAFLLELSYTQCSIHPMWISSWNVQLTINYFSCNSLFVTS